MSLSVELCRARLLITSDYRRDTSPRHIQAHLLHALANLEEELVSSFKPDQTFARVLNIKHDVGEDDRDDREGKDVEPTPTLAG